jgi:O-antigen ligase
MSVFSDRRRLVPLPVGVLGADERTWRGTCAALAAAVFGAALGAALAELPVRSAITLAAAATVALLLAVARSALRPIPRPPIGVATDGDVQHEQVTARPSIEGRLLAVGRGLYLLGAAAIGLDSIRAASFTASDWLFVAALGITGLAVLRAGKVVPLDVPPPVLIGVGLFAVGGLVSSFHAARPLASAAVVARVLYITIPWFWIGVVLLRTKAQLERAVTAWVVSAAISGAAAVAQLFFGNVIPGGDVSYGRESGFTFQYNILGGLTAVAFVPALMITARSKGRTRLLMVPTVALIGAGLLLSGSVGGLLAAAVTTAVWLVASRQAARTLGVFAVLGAGAALLFGATGRTKSVLPTHRFSVVTSSQVSRTHGGTLYSRLDVYRAAWSRIGRDPLVGVGLDPTSAQVGGLEVHNLVLGPWFTAGILGVLGILIVIGSLTGVAFGVVRSAETADERLLALSLALSFLTFVLFAMSEPILYVRYGWAPVAFILALRAHQRRRRQAGIVVELHGLPGA